MSAMGEKAAQASRNISDLETALEKTQRALKSVEKIDEAAGTARRRGSKLFRLLLVAGAVGVTVVVARKLMGGRGSIPPATDPYGSRSTES